MEKIVELRCFVDGIKHIIFSYLTAVDLKTSNISNCLTENQWRDKVKSDFGTILLNQNSKAKFDTWLDYYCHLDYTTYAKARIVKLTPQLAVPILKLESKIKILYDDKWEAYFGVEVYNLMKDLHHADVVVISPTSFLFIKCKTNGYIKGRKCLFRSITNVTDSVFSALLFGDYPIAYWRDSNIFQLDISHLQIKRDNIISCSSMNINGEICTLLVFEVNNVAYATINIGIPFYGRDEYIKFKVVPLTNYSHYISLLNELNVDQKFIDEKISISVMLKKYNLSWNRVLLVLSMIDLLSKK